MNFSSESFPHLGFRVAYRGSAFYGFQRQPNKVTVQEKIESALSTLFPEAGKVGIHFSSRTDAGVSAYDQWVIFLNGVRWYENWPEEKQKRFLVSLNALLKPDISVWQLLRIRKDFRPKQDVKWKEYRYQILMSAAEDPSRSSRTYWVRQNLDLKAIRSALKDLEGVHDFSSFARRAKKTKVKSFQRHLLRAELKVKAHSRFENAKILTFIFRGTGFFQHQCRAMVGSLLQIGRGKPLDLVEILRAKDRKQAGPSVAAEPLLLYETRVKARYFKKGLSLHSN